MKDRPWYIDRDNELILLTDSSDVMAALVRACPVQATGYVFWEWLSERVLEYARAYHEAQLRSAAQAASPG
jgi:hypothetical protein